MQHLSTLHTIFYGYPTLTQQAVTAGNSVKLPNWGRTTQIVRHLYGKRLFDAFSKTRWRNPKLHQTLYSIIKLCGMKILCTITRVPRSLFCNENVLAVPAVRSWFKRIIMCSATFSTKLSYLNAWLVGYYISRNFIWPRKKERLTIRRVLETRMRKIISYTCGSECLIRRITVH